MSKQRRRTAPKPEQPKDIASPGIGSPGIDIPNPQRMRAIDLGTGRSIDKAIQPCPHTVTEEIAYDEPQVGRNVAADRCASCGAVKMRGIGTTWVLPGEKMENSVE